MNTTIIPRTHIWLLLSFVSLACFFFTLVLPNKSTLLAFGLSATGVLIAFVIHMDVQCFLMGASLSEQKPTVLTDDQLHFLYMSRLGIYPRGEYVYLLRDISHTGYVKIGRTNKPLRRMFDFRIKLPFEWRLIGVFSCKDCVALEKELHQKYADKRVNGEWFNLTVEDVGMLQNGYAIKENAV